MQNVKNGILNRNTFLLRTGEQGLSERDAPDFEGWELAPTSFLREGLPACHGKPRRGGAIKVLLLLLLLLLMLLLLRQGLPACHGKPRREGAVIDSVRTRAWPWQRSHIAAYV